MVIASAFYLGLEHYFEKLSQKQFDNVQLKQSLKAPQVWGFNSYPKLVTSTLAAPLFSKIIGMELTKLQRMRLKVSINIYK